VAVQEDPIIKRLGPPDDISYGFSDGDVEPAIFSNKGGFSRWALYQYEVDGWYIQVLTKDKRVVRVTADNIKEAEERARQRGDELRKRLSP
jgi:hypothetical protein